jgi:general stress protein YciG
MATRQRKSADTTVAVQAEQIEQGEKRRRGPRAGTENARRGGIAVREKYGQDFFAKIGSMGGKTVRERLGPEFYASIGRRGGQTTRDTLGTEHYERIGRMGGLRARKRERAAQVDQSTNS